MKKRSLSIAILFIISTSSFAQKNFTQYVDPMIGTGGHGHTYPGAVVPHGMVQLSPDTRLEGWDGCSGYHYSDSFIYGFTHTHLSGTGCSDYGDILLMPITGTPSPDNKLYGSAFSHANEKASPGYYSVKLDNGVNVQLTATERVGFHHYLFGKGGSSIMLDLKHRDEVLESSLQIINDHTVAGFRRSKAWAVDQYVYFVIEFSNRFSYDVWDNDKPVGKPTTLTGKNIKAAFHFETDKPIVMAKVAISGVSIEGAQKNLKAELPGWNFAATKLAAEKKWNAELNKIEVTSNNKKQLSTFYTALYHTMVVPNINMDVDGQYRGRDNKIHTASGFTNYSVFSLWDTHRAAHPLYTIIDKKRTLDYIKTFLVQYKEGGRLPVWELSGNETDCMIGYHSVSVIADAYMKGINQFDTKLALEAMKKSATWNHLGLPALMDHGFLEMDDEHESVSKTLEYSYDDWCIAAFAEALGNKEDYFYYTKRAQGYKNLFDVKTGFMRPRKNGNWVSPFDPREVNNNYTEANSWQYSFSMPHDISGYLKMIGGKKKMEEKLDALFSAPQQTSGREQADITGLIGQYAHGNEPSHHIAYLYNFVDKAYKTQEKVHQIMKEMYQDTPDGLAGNEDCGQMSAWYVLSAMGIYDVTPGEEIPSFSIGTPLFPSVKINLENGKSFTIKANKVSDANFYIQETGLRIGEKKLITGYGGSFIYYSDMMKGGELIFDMGPKPDLGSRLHLTTYVNDAGFVLNPVIDGGDMSFKKDKEVKIYSNDKDLAIYYTTDGSKPTYDSKKYTGPFTIDTTTTVKAVGMNKSFHSSFVTTAKFMKAPNNWDIKLNTAFEQQYDGGGAQGLIDGIHGETNWRKGNWQGYQKTNVDAVIDLQETKNISFVTAGFLQDTKAWIVAPKQFIVEVSTDGRNFKQVFSGEHFLPIEDLTVQVVNLAVPFESVAARYVRIKAIQYGKLPSWHEGAGGDTHIFVDEIGVR